MVSGLFADEFTRETQTELQKICDVVSVFVFFSWKLFLVVFYYLFDKNKN